MDGRRPAEGVTDSALAREIEAALAVDPSPQFVARIRTHIASEPAPASWWQLRWPMLVGAVVASVVVMAVALSWQPVAPEQRLVRGGTDVALTAPTPKPAPSAAPAIAPRVQPSQTNIARALSGESRPARGTVDGPPEVLISRDEQRGLELLLTAVREKRVPASLSSRLVAGEVEVEPADIALSEIVIQPLQQMAALEGESQ
jgi:hypothetical protein